VSRLVRAVAIEDDTIAHDSADDLGAAGELVRCLVNSDWNNQLLVDGHPVRCLACPVPGVLFGRCGTPLGPHPAVAHGDSTGDSHHRQGDRDRPRAFADHRGALSTKDAGPAPLPMTRRRVSDQAAEAGPGGEAGSPAGGVAQVTVAF